MKNLKKTLLFFILSIEKSRAGVCFSCVKTNVKKCTETIKSAKCTKTVQSVFGKDSHSKNSKQTTHQNIFHASKNNYSTQSDRSSEEEVNHGEIIKNSPPYQNRNLKVTSRYKNENHEPFQDDLVVLDEISYELDDELKKILINVFHYTAQNIGLIINNLDEYDLMLLERNRKNTAYVIHKLTDLFIDLLCKNLIEDDHFCEYLFKNFIGKKIHVNYIIESNKDDFILLFKHSLYMNDEMHDFIKDFLIDKIIYSYIIDRLEDIFNPNRIKYRFNNASGENEINVEFLTFIDEKLSSFEVNLDLIKNTLSYLEVDLNEGEKYLEAISNFIRCDLKEEFGGTKVIYAKEEAEEVIYNNTQSPANSQNISKEVTPREPKNCQHAKTNDFKRVCSPYLCFFSTVMYFYGSEKKTEYSKEILQKHLNEYSEFWIVLSMIFFHKNIEENSDFLSTISDFIINNGWFNDYYNYLFKLDSNKANLMKLQNNLLINIFKKRQKTINDLSIQISDYYKGGWEVKITEKKEFIYRYQYILISEKLLFLTIISSEKYFKLIQRKDSNFICSRANEFLLNCSEDLNISLSEKVIDKDLTKKYYLYLSLYRFINQIISKIYQSKEYLKLQNTSDSSGILTPKAWQICDDFERIECLYDRNHLYIKISFFLLFSNLNSIKGSVANLSNSEFEKRGFLLPLYYISDKFVCKSKENIELKNYSDRDFTPFALKQIQNSKNTKMIIFELGKFSGNNHPLVVSGEGHKLNISDFLNNIKSNTNSKNNPFIYQEKLSFFHVYYVNIADEFYIFLKDIKSPLINQYFDIDIFKLREIFIEFFKEKYLDNGNLKQECFENPAILTLYQYYVRFFLILGDSAIKNSENIDSEIIEIEETENAFKDFLSSKFFHWIQYFTFIEYAFFKHPELHEIFKEVQINYN